ncbi:MAG: AMP-binding protein [Stellaceae bacterium]
MRELFDALRYRAEVCGDRLAFDDGTTRLAYSPLARRVAGAAEELRALTPFPPVIGLLGGNRVDWVVGQLAGWHAGGTVVPLPPFFRVSQLRHVVQDAGISHILCTPEMVGTARLLGVVFSPISDRLASIAPPPGRDGAQIIYTSGSTGQPKGVLLESGQMMWSGRALARVIAARDDDTYLSVLPLVLLLETLCAVIIPILAGAAVRLEPALTERFDETDGCAIADVVAAVRPTCMVLVPQLVARWIARLSDAAARAPDSLRFVAVGGAALPPALAQQAWDLGIPVHEGYGLSECGSVVALNRPGDRKSGTVGKPLPGLELRVEDGEIVVSGPSVMDRYLRGSPTHGIWRTGDVGEIDADGVLTVRGRVDNLLVTPMGRNISPEWIESLLSADARVAHCLVTRVDRPHLTAILVPTAEGEDWFERASREEIGALVAARCDEAPSYAVPRHFVVVPARDLVRFGLLTGNGRIRRKATLDAYATMLRSDEGAPATVTQRHLER